MLCTQCNVLYYFTVSREILDAFFVSRKHGDIRLAVNSRWFFGLIFKKAASGGDSGVLPVDLDIGLDINEPHVRNVKYFDLQ